MSHKPASAILFLHALPLDGTMWRFQQGLFDVPCYAPTLYGCGAGIGDWATSALGQVRQERFVIVGNSIGGSCALEIAAAAPDRVAALVLCGTKADCNRNTAFLEEALALMETDGPQAAWKTYWHPLLAPDCSASTLNLAHQIFSGRSVADLVAGTRAFHTRDSRSQVLRDFPGPVAFVSGVQDVAPGPDMSRAQSELALNGTCHIVPDCGHYVPLEAPQAFNDILETVLAPLLP